MTDKLFLVTLLPFQNTTCFTRCTVTHSLTPNMFSQVQQHFCARCAKSFTNESDLARHKNQPKSRCRYDHENVMHFRPRFVNLQSIANKHNHSAMAPAEPEPLETEQFEGHMDVDQPQVGDEAEGEAEETTSPFFTEIYHNVSEIFGHGDTFMDLFDKDPHSDKRKDNLYYPFASRQEWEVALYLLRSSLSMAELDKFLKLELVRPLLAFNISVD
jgi:hypothetical protein